MDTIKLLNETEDFSMKIKSNIIWYPREEFLSVTLDLRPEKKQEHSEEFHVLLFSTRPMFSLEH